ncbi:hypothetical protein QTP86_017302 [Hemibagrus guttatus]|nr:hypothetical protein QTP86_017302 [Hemibagrus guttatus]
MDTLGTGDSSPAQDLVISLNNSMISPSATARNLGVSMDNQLSFSSHVTNVTRLCRFLLYNRIRPFLSTQATQGDCSVFCHFEIGLLQLFIGKSPLNAIHALQMIQNAAARLVFNLPKFSYTTPLLRSLHWLLGAAYIRFKTLMLAYKAKIGPAPSYLKALITPRTAHHSLSSISTAQLVPPSLRSVQKNPERSEEHGEATRGGSEEQGEASGRSEEQGEAGEGSEDHGEVSGGSEEQGKASGGSDGHGGKARGSQMKSTAEQKCRETSTAKQKGRAISTVEQQSRATSTTEQQSRVTSPDA